MSEVKLIKSTLNRDSVSIVLQAVGYQVSSHYKFRMREDEKTASAIINLDGTIHDFGSDFHSDVFDVLQTRGMTFPEAKQFVMEQLGITEVSAIETSFIPVKKQKVNTLTDDRYRQIVSDVERFSNSDKQTFKDEGYKRSALSIAPFWVYKQAEDVNIALFREFTTYDESEQSIVLKIRDYTSKLISYKHRYKYDGKWITAKSTHPNKQCLVNIPQPKDGLYPVFVVEGARDFLMMVLLGLNVVAIPTVNYKEWMQTELSIFEGKSVVLIPDLDEEQKGINCMSSLGKQIDGIAKSVNVIDIRKVLDLMDIEHTETKMDLSDVVLLWDRSLDDFKNTLLYVSDMGVMLPEGEIF